MNEIEETIIMPKTLTAENGAKALLMGEFQEIVIMRCDECEGEGEVIQYDGSDSTGTLITCESCAGSGDYSLKVTVGWTTIKEIYAMYVKYVENKLNKEVDNG